MNKILVTGGLGFIGSHTVVCLMEAGYHPVILDNLSNSSVDVLQGIEKICGAKPEFVNGDINDLPLVVSILENNIQAIIHFAAFKAVGESVAKPLMYYRNNVGGLITLMEAMEKTNVKNIVFSSSCTVYGEPEQVPVTEHETIKPALSPYGATKQMCETILKDAPDVNTQCLRYFNPVGAHPSGFIGELPLGVPNNLVPFITQTAAGVRDKITVYGNDYPTPDGTCIRDYIHVMDLAEAHVASLNRLLGNDAEKFEVYNIGTGHGASVLEVLQTFESVNQLTLPYGFGPRRPGDVVQVYADGSLANEKLGWKATRNLETMLKDAWNWEKTLH